MTRLATLLPLLLLACCSPDRKEPDKPPPHRTLYLLPVRADAELPPEVSPDAVARVEIAADDPSRFRGLMFCDSLRPDHGMLFIYPTEAKRSFWMKNTLIPLSIAFATSTGRIVGILDMQPGGDTPDSELMRYESARPAMYALEMEKGWFGKNGIRVGDRMLFHPEVAAVTVR
jgi:uncharacterized membrane protein (UPF0127 family)